MDFFNKLLEQVKHLWGKWTMVQKLILFGIAAVLFAGIIALVLALSSPSMVAVIDAPIADKEARERIITLINEEGYKTSVTANGVVMVEDSNIARKMRGILIREDLIPKGIDPWKIFEFDKELGCFEPNVNFLRAQTRMIKDHIKALDGVDDAEVSIVMPKDSLFLQDQNPVSASVILIPAPGSDITENRKKVEGIQKILQLAVEGLKDENIVIVDQNGKVLNDFEGLKDSDGQNLVERQQKFVQKMKNEYRAKILASLQKTFSLDQIGDIKIDFDIDKAVSTTKYLPFVYDDLVKDYVPFSKEKYELRYRY